MTRIAISGKGGSGKTTIAAMMVRQLCNLRRGPVLAVDADPNSCLGVALGVEPAGTVAQLRDRAADKTSATAGVDRLSGFEYGLHQVLAEAAGFDLLTMGRPEGPGCYCAANNILRTFLDKLAAQYSYVVIDNEAGMEHLSRRTSGGVDVLCIVAEQTLLGRLTARRIFSLAAELPSPPQTVGVIWNRTQTAERLDGVTMFGNVPFDQAILDAATEGRTVFDIDGSSPALAATQRILEEMLRKISSPCPNGPKADR